MHSSKIYGFPMDLESDDSIPPLDPSSHYVDPWDLENYAYLKEHLDSPELPSDPTSLGDFIEAQSSFDYVPVVRKTYMDSIPTSRYDSMLTDQGTYACIDELGLYERTKSQSDIYGVTPRKYIPNSRHLETRGSVYSHSGSVMRQYEKNKNKKRVPPTKKYASRDRSISFAYGDGYGTYGYRQSIYSNPEEKSVKEDIYYPIYDDPRSIRKPNNFGLSNYGHLKIDYSYSWNNLDKYIVG